MEKKANRLRDLSSTTSHQLRIRTLLISYTSWYSTDRCRKSTWSVCTKNSAYPVLATFPRTDEILLLDGIKDPCWPFPLTCSKPSCVQILSSTEPMQAEYGTHIAPVSSGMENDSLGILALHVMVVHSSQNDRKWQESSQSLFWDGSQSSSSSFHVLTCQEKDPMMVKGLHSPNPRPSGLRTIAEEGPEMVLERPAFVRSGETCGI